MKHRTFLGFIALTLSRSNLTISKDAEQANRLYEGCNMTKPCKLLIIKKKMLTPNFILYKLLYFVPSVCEVTILHITSQAAVVDPVVWNVPL